MKVTEETKEHAQAILDFIQENPERHSQVAWVRVRGADLFHVITENNFCHTTLCIAGTSMLVSEGIDAVLEAVVENGFVRAGAEKLGLSSREADKLFYDMNDEHALDALRAIANGDQEKFNELYALDSGGFYVSF